MWCSFSGVASLTVPSQGRLITPIDYPSEITHVPALVCEAGSLHLLGCRWFTYGTGMYPWGEYRIVSC